jgi:IS30 family transposase
MARKKFTIEEREKIKQLFKERFSISKIAKILGRSESSLYYEISNKTIDGEYLPEQFLLYKNKRVVGGCKEIEFEKNKESILYEVSMGNSYKCISKKYNMSISTISRCILKEKLKNQNTKYKQTSFDFGEQTTEKPNLELEQRIESLEMQIETLFEIVKNIGKK